MNRILRLTLLTVGLATLVLVVGLLWLWKSGGLTVSSPHVPEIPAALKAAREAAGKTALQREAAREKDIWKTRYPEAGAFRLDHCQRHGPRHYQWGAPGPLANIR